MAAPDGRRDDVEPLVPRDDEICGPGGVGIGPGRAAHLRMRRPHLAPRRRPALAVLPETAEQVAAVVRVCARAGVPFVARGSGTGLSGGALPRTDGVLIVTSTDAPHHRDRPGSQRAIVEPGVTNLAVSTAARPFGLFYAPDPSSQLVCSIGGNVAENSGGAHCLKYGFTVHHVTGLEIVTPDGELTSAGRRPRQRARLRPGRRVHRLRRHAGDRHQDHRAADPDPAGGHHPAGRLRDAPARAARRCPRSSGPASCPRPSR